MEQQSTHPETESPSFDYAFVETVGRIALYDDLRSAPRIIEIQPADTASYIEALSSQVYEHARAAGGSIPYTVVREVSENFIHAQFKEVVVSVFDGGNTVRFADHGPGIPSKEKAQKPGFSSATEPMKSYIRGVGSGLPIVREYLESSHGTITIEDNLGTGAVVTISLVHDDTGGFDEVATDRSPQTAVPTSGVTPPSTGVRAAAAPAPTAAPPATAATAGTIPSSTGGYPAGPLPYPADNPYQMPTTGANWGGCGHVPAQPAVSYPAPQPYGAAAYPQPGQAYPPYGATAFPTPQGYPASIPQPPLGERERAFLAMLLSEGPLGVTEMSGLTETPQSSTHSVFTKLEEAGLVQKVGKLRSLTPYGQQVAQSL